MNLLEGLDQESALRQELLSKWKDKPVEELLEAKVNSDLYIKSLESQKDELRDMYDKQRDELLAKAKFEELIDRMNKPSGEVPPTLGKEPESPKQMEIKDIESLVLQKIQETEARKNETKNFNEVQNKLKERFGDNYVSSLKDYQRTLGLSDTDVNSLAMKSPKAFFQMLGINETEQAGFTSPPRSGQRNDHFAPKTPKRDFQYYQELKKTNPKIYLDPKIQVQMHNDAIALGAAFGLPPE